MKKLKNKDTSICGVKYLLFSILHDSSKKEVWGCYVNAIGSGNVGDCLVYKGASRSRFWNKYTLSFVGIFYNLYTFTLKWPMAILGAIFFAYFDGGRNFVRDCAWQNNVRYFNWVNIVLVAILSALLIMKW